MQETLEKIEKSAASRLAPALGRPAAEELNRFRTFLKVETHRLKILHRGGTDGLIVCRARSAILDHVLRHLWECARGQLSAEEQKAFPPMALVAIGGYGRGELNPHSDVDIMFLHSMKLVGGKPAPLLSKMVDSVLYPLWDLKLKVGYSVRTVDECVKVANSDMQSKTSLIESRLITGDEPLFTKFKATVLKKCVEGFEVEYIKARIADQAARRARFGNSASMQEPNLKNGCGGLRDFHNLLWMAWFKYRTRSLRDLMARSYLSEGERRQLRSAYDFLLRVRNEMHYHTNRPTDVLSKSLQPAVAFNLGYKEREISKRIEVFMRDVYTHFRNIYLITRTLEQRLALRPEFSSRLETLRSWLPGARPKLSETVDGFLFVDGEIHAAKRDVFYNHPRRLMRVFLHAQQRGLRLHPNLAQMIRNQLQLVDRFFRSDEHVRNTFLTILSQRGAVAPILRAMHEVDFLGKYIPEFGRLTCLVQHEFYHQYTADEHTLMCMEQLDRVMVATTPRYAPYSPLLQGLERPFILYLAMLLHDVGKSDDTGKHEQVSGRLAMRVARRLALDPTATNSLRLVIENHLLMANVSQRRDLDDPAVIRHFAKEVETPENLTLLTLHTFADAMATSDKLWNGFKDTLLWALHFKTMHLMSGGPEFAKAEEQVRAARKEEVRKVLPAVITEEELNAHISGLPLRYFQLHTAAEIQEDLEMAHEFMQLQICEDDRALIPVVRWKDERDRGCSVVKVCTWDRAGLFNKIAGALSATGLSILTAQIFTRSDGIAEDTFAVVDARTGNLVTAEQQEEFRGILEEALSGAPIDLHALIRRQKITRPTFQAYSGEQIPVRVHFDNDSSETRSLIEIEAEDRVGLLYSVSEELSALGLDISAARICTEKGAAIDTFYVREIDGEKVDLDTRQDEIRSHLIGVINKLDRAS